MGPMKNENLDGKRYVFVYVNDFSHFPWVEFFKENFEAFNTFKRLCFKIMNEKGERIRKNMLI